MGNLDHAQVSFEYSGNKYGKRRGGIQQQLSDSSIHSGLLERSRAACPGLAHTVQNSGANLHHRQYIFRFHTYP